LQGIPVDRAYSRHNAKVDSNEIKTNFIPIVRDVVQSIIQNNANDYSIDQYSSSMKGEKTFTFRQSIPKTVKIWQIAKIKFLLPPVYIDVISFSSKISEFLGKNVLEFIKRCSKSGKKRPVALFNGT